MWQWAKVEFLWEGVVGDEVLVLGLGNTFRQDDGLGVRAVERLLQRYELPAEVRVRVGAVLGVHLLTDLEGVQHLIVVDAIRANNPPGTLIRLEGEEVPHMFTARVSLHEMALSELLALAEVFGFRPPHIVALGLVPASMGMGPDLSPEIAERLDMLVEAVWDEIVSCVGFL